MALVPPPELLVEVDPLEFEVGKPPAAARTRKEKMYATNVKNRYDIKTSLKILFIIS